MALPKLISENRQRIDLHDLPSPKVKLDIHAAKTTPEEKTSENLTELSNTVQVTPQKIPFTMLRQPTDSNWCWAAAAVSISRFLDPVNNPWTMGSLVRKAFDPACSVATCNVQWCLQNALHLTGNYCSFTGPLNDNELFRISEELKNNRPVCCRVKIRGTVGHFVVITAISIKDGEPWIMLEDPSDGGEIEQSIASFRNYFRTRRNKWTHTFFTKKKGGEHGN
jgi:hypothetical protein